MIRDINVAKKEGAAKGREVLETTLANLAIFEAEWRLPTARYKVLWTCLTERACASDVPPPARGRIRCTEYPSGSVKK
jgi:hypothetical protein